MRENIDILAMGPLLSPPQSNPAPKKIPILSLSDNEPDPNESNSEFSGSELSDGELMNNTQAQHLWEYESLSKFGLVCASVANDSEFDRLNNKLLIALKAFCTTNEIYCIKCKAMKSMTKRGKASKTYQFNCGDHTVSATQILSTLPDSFIMRNVPNEPRQVFNQTITWLGKEQLCPELQQLSSKRNAVKRFSAHRSPIKIQTSSLLHSRNSVNELIIEVSNLKGRSTAIEQALELQKKSNSNLNALNAGLLDQVKLLKEENEILKRHLNEPTGPSIKFQSNIFPSTSTSSYANVSNINKPMNKIMKFYTQASLNPSPRSPIEVISAATPVKPPTPKEEFSPLKVVVFKGCHRKSIGTYKTMLPTIGFEAHWARHVIFLAEDLLQITTFECKVDLLIKGMQSISSEVKHLPNFDPFAGASYADYGTLTDETASKCYLSVMKNCATKLQTDCKRTPSLRRIAFFLTKLVETKSINFDPAPRPTRVFCLGDYIKKKEPATTAMDIEVIDTNDESANSGKIDLETEHADTKKTESASEAPVKETSSTAHDQ